MENDLYLLTRRHQERWLVPTFVSVLAFLCGIYAFLYFNARSLQEKTVEVSESFRVMNELDLLLSALKDAESSQRGFIISGDREFLAPYNSSLAKIDRRENSLRQLISDRPDLQPRLETYRQLIRTRLQMLQHPIDTFNENGQIAALKEYRSSLGARTMERVKDFHNEFREDERKNHVRYLQEYNERSGLMGTTYFVAGAFTFVVVGAAFFVVARILRRQEQDRWIKAMVANIARLLSGDLEPKAIERTIQGFFAKNFDAIFAKFCVDSGKDGQGPTDCSGVDPEIDAMIESLRRDRRVRFIDGVPAGYRARSSSDPGAAPRQIVLVPFAYEDRVSGVLELAVKVPLSPAKRHLIIAVSEAAGIYLNSALSRLQQRSLLLSSQEQASELAVQKERLVETNRMLELQARELMAAKSHLQQHQAELRQSNTELEQQTAILEEQKRTMAQQMDQLNELKSRAEEVSKTKSRFLANMSHEIRTPLGAILGFAEMLSESGQMDGENNEFVDAILRNGQLLKQLIDDILDISKIEAGRLVIEKRECDFKEIMDEMRQIFYPVAKAKSLELLFRYSPEIPKTIVTDPIRLKQILINIIGNSLKFTTQGHVVVDSSYYVRAGDHPVLSLSVKDTGCGIARETMDGLFQPFVQADASTTRLYGGTGLGLSISSHLAHCLGGDVRLVSSIVGYGSIFQITIDPGEVSFVDSVTIPAAEPGKSISEMLRKSPTLRLDGVRLLVVDDMPDNLLLMRRMLSLAGADVLCADSGERSIDLLRDRTFDAVLMDIQMPGIDGHTTTRIIRDMELAVPVIAVTAHTGDDHRAQSFRSGCDDHLTKPVDYQNLIRTITFHISSRERTKGVTSRLPAGSGEPPSPPAGGKPGKSGEKAVSC
jgi:signal transduction histidine kinase/ActR/RegA family two-component response regulator